MILIDHDYHIVEFNRFIPTEVWQWCKEKFGPATGNRWFVKSNKLYFADSKDHLMFVLVWGDK